MRWFWGCLVMFLISIVPGFAEINKDSVVAMWLFDEGSGQVAFDNSGNGHNGEIKGNLEWIDGVFGRALSFPGQNGSFVLVPHDESLNLVTFMLVAWLKAENTGTRQEIIMKRAEGGVNSQNLHFQIESGRTNVDLGFTVNNTWPASFHAQTNVCDEKWHHVAGTYDLEMMRIFVDGVPDGEMARNAEPDHNDAPLTIGAVFTTGGSPLKGALDEVAIFNVALELEDIESIMTDGLEATVGATPVSPQGRLATLWGDVKNR